MQQDESSSEQPDGFGTVQPDASSSVQRDGFTSDAEEPES